MKFMLNKSDMQPLYLQLINYIKSKISSGELMPESRMLAERELASNLGVSRGTVKKAYEILVKEGFLKSVQGSGTYVSTSLNDKINGRDHIVNLIQCLTSSGYSLAEIESMFLIGLKSFNDTRIKVAAIECNSETLIIIEHQLNYLNLTLDHYLLDDILKFKNGDEVFANFDLIITTSSHYRKLEQLLPKSYQSGKINRIALSPDFNTIMDLSNLSHVEVGEVGIISRTERFASIIEENLSNFSINLSISDKLLITKLNSYNFSLFIKSRKYIIMPPIYTINVDNSINQNLLNYYKNGGKIITFNYIIERGSLLHLEELTGKGV